MSVNELIRELENYPAHSQVVLVAMAGHVAGVKSTSVYYVVRAVGQGADPLEETEIVIGDLAK